MKTWNYEISGTGGDGQTWATEGTITCEYAEVFNVAARSSFEKLTAGKAVFGKPGVGCRGPYDVHLVLIEQVKQ